MTQPLQPDTVEAFREDDKDHEHYGLWRWHRFAANGAILSEASEGYDHKIDCLSMMNQLNYPRNGVAPSFIEMMKPVNSKRRKEFIRSHPQQAANQ